MNTFIKTSFMTALTLCASQSFIVYAGGLQDLVFISSFEVQQNIDCSVTISPEESFADAFAQLSAGETLCLNDGTYHQAMDIPSDINVRAVNDGLAEIDGESILGEQWTGGLVQMKGNNSSVRGLRVHHAHSASNACHMVGTNNTMRLMSCAHGGSHKHKIPIFIGGSGHLLEDSWAFGEGRYVVQCFTGRNITIRHNVARWDKTVLFNSDGSSTQSEPNAAFSIYNCSDVTIENNISIDYGPTGQYMKFGGDFYSPQNCSVWPEGNNNNHYLGNYAVNHVTGTNNDNRKGIRFEADCTSIDNVVIDFYARDEDIGILIGAAESGMSLSNCSFSNIVFQEVIGNGSNASLTCSGAADIGARYVDRVKVDSELFPWVHEEMIKTDMCRTGERQSDWCLTDQTLSEYVLEL